MEERADVVVVGAGIIGLSVAWHLRTRGIDALVLERTGVGSGASGQQPGGVRQQWGTRVNCLLARESVAFYHRATELLDSPVELRFRECGYLFLAHSDAALERLRVNVELQNELGVPSRLVGALEAAELVPGLETDGVAGASWCDEDGYFDRPQSVLEAFARPARVEHAEVVELRRGTHWSLLLRDGRRFEAQHVVVASGVDTPRLIELPIEPEQRYLFLSEPIRERLLEPLVVSAERRFAAKQLADGRVLASDLAAAGDESNAPAWRTTISDRIHELLPALTYVSFPILVPGVYDATPDRQAILGRVPARANLWVAAGFSGHGFMLAPAVGRILADAIAGGAEDEALGVLDARRFAESRLVPEPQVV